MGSNYRRFRWRIGRPNDWAINDFFYLRYADSRRFSHRFYTGPPDDPSSVKILPGDLCVDKQATFQILDLSTSVRANVTYITARFQFQGQSLWTNLAKDNHSWAFKRTV